MRQLIQLLLNNRELFVFLILQLICFALIINAESFHRTTFYATTNEVNGFVSENFKYFGEYWSLAEVNEELAKENAFLRNLKPNSDSESPFSKVDSFTLSQYHFIPAKVVRSSHQKRMNYVTINMGSDEGVTPGMGVLSPNGIVGVVNGVSNHYASVIPLIHPKGRVTGKIYGTSFFGPVIWGTNSFRTATMADVPKQANVKEGDLIVTDIRSSVFPPNEPIGTIKKIDQDQETGFYKFTLELATDFSALNYVYVVGNKGLEEQLELEGNFQNEE